MNNSIRYKTGLVIKPKNKLHKLLINLHISKGSRVIIIKNSIPLARYGNVIIEPLFTDIQKGIDARKNACKLIAFAVCDCPVNKINSLAKLIDQNLSDRRILDAYRIVSDIICNDFDRIHNDVEIPLKTLLRGWLEDNDNLINPFKN
jgi:hypothetical protein